MKKRTHLSLKQLLLFAVMLFAFSGITLFLFTFRQDEKRFDNITSQIFADEMSSNTLNMHYTLEIGRASCRERVWLKV